jgi:hypothetical protein
MTYSLRETNLLGCAGVQSILAANAIPNCLASSKEMFEEIAKDAIQA